MNPLDALRPVLKPELVEALEPEWGKAGRPAMTGRNPVLDLTLTFGEPDLRDLPLHDLNLRDLQLRDLQLSDSLAAFRDRQTPDMAVRSLSFTPLEGFTYQMLDTLHEGAVAYQAYGDYWIRMSSANHPDRHVTYGTNFFSSIPPTRDDDMQFFRDLVFGPGLDEYTHIDPEMRTWQFLAGVWVFLKRSTVFDLNAFRYYSQLNGGDPWSVPFYRRMWEQEGKFILGACNSKAALLGIMLVAAGVEPWRHGICSTRYKAQTPGQRPNHVYNTVYYDGRWRIMDLQTVASLFPAMPGLGDVFPWVRNTAATAESECDYSHPFAMEQPAHRPVFNLPTLQCPGVPLLGCAPYETEVPDPLFEPPV